MAAKLADHKTTLAAVLPEIKWRTS